MGIYFWGCVIRCCMVHKLICLHGNPQTKGASIFIYINGKIIQLNGECCIAVAMSDYQRASTLCVYLEIPT